MEGSKEVDGLLEYHATPIEACSSTDSDKMALLSSAIGSRRWLTVWKRPRPRVPDRGQLMVVGHGQVAVDGPVSCTRRTSTCIESPSSSIAENNRLSSRSETHASPQRCVTACYYKRHTGQNALRGGPACKSADPSSTQRHKQTAQRHTITSTRHSLPRPSSHPLLSRSALPPWPSPFVVPAPSLRPRGLPRQHPTSFLSSNPPTRGSEAASSQLSPATLPRSRLLFLASS